MDTPTLLAVPLLFEQITLLPGRAQPIFWGSQLLLQGFSALTLVWYLEITRSSLC